MRSAQKEPDDYAVDNMVPWSQDPATFTYSDGGILQNQPLGMAKNLVDMIDLHLDQEERFYLFVSPHAKDPQANDTFHEANADYLRLTQRLLDLVLGQAGFQDWITAKGINKRVELLDERADGLKKAIQAGEIDVPALQTTATSLLVLFFPGGSHRAPGSTAPETLEAAKKRIAKQYRAEMVTLGEKSGQAPAFRDAVLAFETAAGLGARDFMTIYGVTATQDQLAGAGFGYVSLDLAVETVEANNLAFILDDHSGIGHQRFMRIEYKSRDSKGGVDTRYRNWPVGTRFAIDAPMAWDTDRQGFFELHPDNAGQVVTLARGDSGRTSTVVLWWRRVTNSF